MLGEGIQEITRNLQYLLVFGLDLYKTSKMHRFDDISSMLYRKEVVIRSDSY